MEVVAGPAARGAKPLTAILRLAGRARGARAVGYRTCPNRVKCVSPESGSCVILRRAPAVVVVVVVMSVHLHFEPAHALIGGAILGVATVGKLLLTGRVLGISGSFKGLVTIGDTSRWRFAFLAGLVGSGLADAYMNPDQVAEPSAGLTRTVVAGLLVGAGSGLGNGCTSGHGICGNSRFAPRSMAYTVLFMATGFAAATLFDTNAALGVNPASALDRMKLPSAEEMIGYGKIIAAAAASFLGLGQLARAHAKKNDGEHTDFHDTLGLVAEVISGFVFGLGLSISGMRRAAKVSGFLSATASSWDPSLMLVMGGAMGLAIPAFARSESETKPHCAREFSVPPKNRGIDKNLLLGGVMFGAGWGLAGMCPGPAIVSFAANPTGTVGAWLLAVVVGMYAQHRVF